MEMTNDEIVKRYVQSGHTKEQIKILAELNDETQKTIRDILKAAGVFKESTPKPKQEAIPRTEPLNTTVIEGLEAAAIALDDKIIDLGGNVYELQVKIDDLNVKIKKLKEQKAAIEQAIKVQKGT